MDIKSALLGELNVIQVAASTNAEETTKVYERMAGITRFLYENLPSYDIAGFVVFLLVFVLSAIVYKLGFAKKLKLSQNIAIYVFLFLGCIMLTFFALFLPMIEGLIVAALILIVYKTRMWREKREEQQAANQ
ncbi:MULTISPECIES: YlaH-like family protein [Lysinibacillus]|uniref:YlaH-like family protein n=1 Tax=Lysinibacillus xylanilyticus TaxID=582475 RepID=A0ABT4ER70_9BACI|nr:YlaH-like family protein [Lysinibacillus xylanilyticus]MCY9548173.1 YlaH-like family protein [Lysinibacillus xylanilyticus]MED3804630.1 YlaH-like family protein [Lysinibacillus xylanilyticus]